MSDSALVDVAVVGGGPAGLATAGALARRGASVTVLERASSSALRLGETLGAEVRPLLGELGAWEAVEDVLRTQLPFRGVRSAWGSDVLSERASIVHPLGEGWLVDRARFDARLGEWAVSQCASLRVDVGACDVVCESDGSLRIDARGGAVFARTVVDASGRGAPATSSIDGRRWLA